jgi:hypothetical protein
MLAKYCMLHGFAEIVNYGEYKKINLPYWQNPTE